MPRQIKESLTVSPYLLWFMIHGTQTGIAMLNFQSRNIKGAQQDSWLSLLLVGLSLHAVVWIIYAIMKHADGGDILHLHRQLFGKWLGGAMNLLFYGYMLLFIVYQIRSYMEVIHIWAFPTTPFWFVCLLILLTAVYIVTGGLRVITGICFFCVVIPTLLLVSIYFPLQYAHWTNFLPLLNHSPREYAQSAFHSLNLFYGVEFLLLLHPFIKHPEKSRKWAHIAVAHSTVLYLIVAIVTLAFFNVQQLEHTIWPTLILSKVARLPFIDRFDYVYVFNWFIVILPPVCMAMWAGTRILRQVTPLRSKPLVWFTCGMSFVIIAVLQGPKTIDKLDSVVTWAGLTLLYVYLPLLCLWVHIIQRYHNRRAAVEGG
ncbi:spore germination protein [Paenibacillus cellulositrophicus]|uniref:GerAB/ArcD/ProY family transporter n=1 Tax=Paenibacillus cellulositrophicus TaxID=562959 RepID=UPI00203E872B|nr:GerAB/ArcD/ProY family transporter [Paenibacillus cellulositrophicus]MCM3000546.1 spore germination protein [Paenibacillus cellulositrophicus]